MQVINDKRKLYFFLILLLIAFGALVYYSKNSQDEVAIKELRTMLEKKVVRDIKIDGKDLTVEVANSRHKKQNGLKYRKELPENEGMLFLFGLEGYYRFWLKDTLMPLDIIWINKDLEVVHVVKDAQSCVTSDPDECDVYTPSAPAKYVVEVGAGWASKNNIDNGDIVEMDGETREELEQLDVEDSPGISFF